MRQSNIELLRIVSMLLVLLIHVSLNAFSYPVMGDLIENPVSNIGLLYVESLSVVCVIVFVLISGWFGIQPKVKSLATLLFQVCFFQILVYIFAIILGYSTFSVDTALRTIKLNWFIDAYLLLYIISPILNAYIEKVSSIQLRNMVRAYFVMLVCGWVFSTQQYVCGYTTLLFIGLYLLARYVRLYKNNAIQKKSCSYFFYCFLLLTLLNVLILLLPIFVKLVGFGSFEHLYSYLANKVFSYVSPIVTLQSLMLLVGFHRFTPHSLFCVESRVSICVNWIASSCFAVYLIHTHPIVFEDVFILTIRGMHCNSEVNTVISIFLFMVVTFVFAIFLDKVRLFIWECLWKKNGHKIESKINKYMF